MPTGDLPPARVGERPTHRTPEPAAGLLQPCNGVVRALDDATTVVEALDPQVIVSVTHNDALSPVADDVGRLLQAALDTVTHAFADE